MATKKAKRYEEGGDVESYEDTNAGMKEAYDNRAPLDTSDEDLSRGGKEPATEAAPKQSFSQAFAAARKGGASIFEFNGKKYTTDVAGNKPSVKATDTASDVRREARGTSAPKVSSGRGTMAGATAEDRAPKTRGVVKGTTLSEAMDMYSKNKKAREESSPKVDTSKLTAKAAGKAAQDRGVMGGAMANFKKGGKINGIAQRGKTRGRIV